MKRIRRKKADIKWESDLFFQDSEQQAYAQTSDEELKIELDNFIININRCMIDINFRREPIYLSDDTLDSPKYAQYRFAVANIRPYGHSGTYSSAE